MKPADIIILLIVIVAMVFAARKAAGHFKWLLYGRSMPLHSL